MKFLKRQPFGPITDTLTVGRIFLYAWASLCLVLLLCSFFCASVADSLLMVISLSIPSCLMLSSEEHHCRGDIALSIIIGGLALIDLPLKVVFYAGTTALSEPNYWRVDSLSASMFGMLFFGVYAGCVALILLRALWRLIFQSELQDLVIRLALFAALLLALKIGLTMSRAGHRGFAEGLARTAKAEIDMPSIQEWLTRQETPAEPDENSFEYSPKGIMFSTKDGRSNIPVEHQPEYVKKLSNNMPISVRYDWDTEEFYTGRGELLGRYDSWGLVIGPPTMAIPPSIDEGGESHVIKLCPGAYVWH